MPYKPVWLPALLPRPLPVKGQAREDYCDNRYEIVVATDNPAALERTCSAAGKAL